MTKVPHDQTEVLAIVNENNEVIGKATRKEIHKKGLLHREVYVYVINSKKKILLQKRRNNGFWDHACGGHISWNQDYLEAAGREFEEELGIKLGAGEFHEVTLENNGEKYETDKIMKINCRLARIFLVKKNISLEDFSIDEGELEGVKYFSLKELKELFDSPKKVMTGSSKKVIKKYFLKRLK